MYNILHYLPNNVINNRNIVTTCTDDFALNAGRQDNLVGIIIIIVTY